MVAESELAKDGGEGARPGDVVGVVEVEDDGHAVEDVDAVDDRRCGRFGLDAECVWGRPDSASELSEAADDEDEDELMASGWEVEAAES